MDIQMSKTRWIIGIATLSMSLTFGLGSFSSTASADRHSDKHSDKHKSQKYRSEFQQNTVYVEECGACHMAYPPGLLPAVSWHNMMMTLEDHFGENAEIDKQTKSHITSYLERQSLGKNRYSRMGKMSRNLPEVAPMRISELPYFIRKHDEIPEGLVGDNSEVGSLSQCDSCHKQAEKGDFDEDHITIPGFGPWDD